MPCIIPDPNQMARPYPTVDVGDIYDLDAVPASDLNLLVTSEIHVVAHFGDRLVMMYLPDVVDFVGNGVYLAILIAPDIFVDSFPDGLEDQLKVYIRQPGSDSRPFAALARDVLARYVYQLLRCRKGRGCRRSAVLHVHGN